MEYRIPPSRRNKKDGRLCSRELNRVRSAGSDAWKILADLAPVEFPVYPNGSHQQEIMDNGDLMEERKPLKKIQPLE